jgi:hypothetical protein
MSLQVLRENNELFLAITLTNESVVKIPKLDESVIEEIFSYHEKSLEGNFSEPMKPPQPTTTVGANPLTMSLPFKLSDMESISNIGTVGGLLQHSQEQANFPNLPQEFITKINSVSKALGLDHQLENVAKPEPHCNCPYCQIARALHEQEPTSIACPKEEAVHADELKFREWDIQETDRNLYEVINPLDPSEHYQVFLGKPIGCTCGLKNCEHIKAVLNS